jgi:DNA-binding Lrp family transcriptional regulator
MKRQLTERDLELLRLLQTNARESVSSLARKLGVSRTAVQERINRLVRDGVIESFTVRLSSQWTEGQITAMVALTVDPKLLVQVIAALERMPEIQALWTVSGRSDLLAMARAPTTAEIDRVLDEVGAIRGVTRTESSIILSTKFERR